MGRVLTIFGSLRVPVLLFVLPYSMLWMRSSESGGWLMVIAHAALVLFGFAGVDASMLRRGGEPRLALRRGGATGGWFDLRVIEVSRAVLGITALVLGMVLLFVQWKIGATVIVALVLMEVGSDGFSERWRHSRFAWAEWFLPLAVLIGPALMVAASAESRRDRLEIELGNAQKRLADVQTAVRPEEITSAREHAGQIADMLTRTELMSHGVFWATVIGAIALGAYVALCLRRDEMLDRGEGMWTTATRFGRGFTGVVIVVMLAGVSGLGAWGAHHGWWGPWGTVIGAWGALLAAWASASDRDDTAVGVWYLSHLALAVAFSLTVV